MSVSDTEKLDWSVLTAEHIENEQLKALYNKVGRVLERFNVYVNIKKKL